MFANLTDEQLLTMLDRQEQACLRVVQMSDEERHRIGPKGNASPAQAGAMNAMLAVMAQREAAKRGLVAATYSAD